MPAVPATDNARVLMSQPPASPATREEALKRMAERLESVGMGADAYTQVAARSSLPGKAYQATRAIGSSVIGNVKGALWFTGLFSLAWNAGTVLFGRTSVPDAGANVAGDLVSNVVGGAAGATASTLGTLVLGAILGPGPVLTVSAAGLGLVMFFVADALVKRSGFYKQTKVQVRQMLSQAS
ncbi:MAG: hypothetical protein VKP62_02070 [Candidatus Sericytochromatia bacterium]|nr:hypothetical protein [Candidatus Sericytochromatia bacterium]